MELEYRRLFRDFKGSPSFSANSKKSRWSQKKSKWPQSELKNKRYTQNTVSENGFFLLALKQTSLLESRKGGLHATYFFVIIYVVSFYIYLFSEQKRQLLYFINKCIFSNIFTAISYFIYSCVYTLISKLFHRR